MFRKTAFAFAAALAFGSFAIAQTVTSNTTKTEEVKPLHIGDPAPALDISDWIKGKEIKKFEPGKVYVVEFWATWCGPCRASMPHLAELQTKYRDYGVTFIGISDEELKTVTDFLTKENKEESKKWDDIITYTLTTDPDRSVKDTYMNGVGAMGIPCAFIVGKDTKIEWSGNPHPKADDNFNEALEAVVKDEWNRDTFAKEFEPKAEKNRAQMAKMLAERAKAKPHQEALKKAIETKDVKAATEALDALIALNPKSPAPKVQKFETLLQCFDAPEAYTFGDTLATENWDNAMILNQLAWFVVDTAGIKTRDLEFAHRLATRAVELEGTNAASLDTVARVYYEKGDLKSAVQWQKKAVEHVEEGPMGEEITATLKKYEDELAKKKGTR